MQRAFEWNHLICVLKNYVILYMVPWANIWWYPLLYCFPTSSIFVGHYLCALAHRLLAMVWGALFQSVLILKLNLVWFLQSRSCFLFCRHSSRSKGKSYFPILDSGEGIKPLSGNFYAICLSTARFSCEVFLLVVLCRLNKRWEDLSPMWNESPLKTVALE